MNDFIKKIRADFSSFNPISSLGLAFLAVLIGLLLLFISKFSGLLGLGLGKNFFLNKWANISRSECMDIGRYFIFSFPFLLLPHFFLPQKYSLRIRQWFQKFDNIIYWVYLVFFLLITFIQPTIRCFDNARICVRPFGSDPFKFILLANQNLDSGKFHDPGHHGPGHELINTFLLYLDRDFPLIPFYAFLACLLSALLLKEMYLFLRKKLSTSWSFFAPLTLILPSYSKFLYGTALIAPNTENLGFLRTGSGLFYGTTMGVVSICLGFIYLLKSLEEHKKRFLVYSASYLIFSSYLWSYYDYLVTTGSLIILLLIGLTYATRISFLSFFRRKQLLWIILIIWIGTAPYKLFYRHHFMMVNASAQAYKIAWQPANDLSSDDEKSDEDLENTPNQKMSHVTWGGGHTLCRSYPDACQALHDDPDLSYCFNEKFLILYGKKPCLDYFKKLSLQNVFKDPLAIVSFKKDFFYDFWFIFSKFPSYLWLENMLILATFITSVFLAFMRKGSQESKLLTASVCFTTAATIGMLTLAHIEIRYLLPTKFLMMFVVLMCLPLARRFIRE